MGDHLTNDIKEKGFDEEKTEIVVECSEILKPPQCGMNFGSFNDFYEYYRRYGKQEGFGIKRSTSKISSNGKLKFFSLACSRAGKSQSHKENYFIPNPLTKLECKARVNGTLFEDGRCKINTVVLEHNHGLSPQKSRFYLCNREISKAAQRKLELNDRAGISVTKNFQTFVVEAGGYDNVPFLEKDCRNHVEKARRLRLGVGDAAAVRDYFVRMQTNNSNFFYAMDLDDDSRIKNLLWADERSRTMYEEFGDVVTFDTTYLTNKYDMPFAPIVGVNHHGHSILFGCALISSESVETFIWLFKTWLACMFGRHPKSIITDQDKAMKKAIEVVFPETRHRWCLWHIMKKIPEKFNGYQSYKQIKTMLKSIVYNSFSKEEFERRWDVLINSFNLQGNTWLANLYEERNRWVPIFVKDTFWAGMSTTQRSESMNSFFDGYVNSKTTLKQFVELYDNALNAKIEKENLADFKSFSTVIPCVTPFEIEKQFQESFTNAKFKEFQKELTGKLYCNVSCVDENFGSFDVCEVVFFKEESKEVHFNVYFNKENFEVECSCQMFQFKGILCKHAISILIQLGVKSVPMKYVVSRWRKNLKRRHTTMKVCDAGSSSPESQRYRALQKKFEKMAEWAVTSDEKFKLLLSWIDNFEINVNENDQHVIGSRAKTCPTEVVRETTKVLSPIPVRRHGRPPTKRKVSVIEKSNSIKKKTKSETTQKKARKAKITNLETSIVHDNNSFTTQPLEHSNIPTTEQVLISQSAEVSYFQNQELHYFGPYHFPSDIHNAQDFISSSQGIESQTPHSLFH